MRYAVTITETSKMAVTVEAENQFEAEQIVSDRWHKCEYVLDADNFCNVEFSVEKVPDTILKGAKNNENR